MTFSFPVRAEKTKTLFKWIVGFTAAMESCISFSGHVEAAGVNFHTLQLLLSVQELLIGLLILHSFTANKNYKLELSV